MFEKNYTQNLRAVISQYLSDTSGAGFPLFGLSLLVLIGATGAVIDITRANQVQVRLSSALDAAGLAAGATINTADVQVETEKYLRTNFRDYMGSTLTNVTATISADNTVITLSASADVPMAIMHLFGFSTITVSAGSEITRTSKGLELAMVLDNTGSMSGSKLSSLKTAAADLLNILYGNRDTVDDLWVGLVPFSQSVNIGTGRVAWTANDSFNWGPTSWAGCVEARLATNQDVTDDPPSSTPFTKYYWACNRSYNGWYGTNRSRNNCDTGRGMRYRSGLGVSRGPNKYCPQPVLGLTASKQNVLNAVNAMQAVGYTHINFGAAWGWRMLSPRWRGLWGGEMDAANLPLDYNTENMHKAVIIMTDGDNTMSNSSDTAYGYLWQGLLGTTSSGTAENRLDSRLSTVCTAMKQNNIIVYTISFGYVSGSSHTLLRNCASQVDYYFPSPSSADLQQAFRAIGDSLANLRISK